MKRYEVTFTIKVDESIDPADVLAWVQFEVGERGEISTRNPLHKNSLEADSFSVVLKECD